MKRAPSGEEPAQRRVQAIRHVNKQDGTVMAVEREISLRSKWEKWKCRALDSLTNKQDGSVRQAGAGQWVLQILSREKAVWNSTCPLISPVDLMCLS